MNVLTLEAIDDILVRMGSSSLSLGSGSIGLIAAPFTPAPMLTIAEVVEANYTGYARQSIGNPTIPFTSPDGLRYVEGTTRMFMPSDTVTPNTIYGAFITFGDSSAAAFLFDKLAANVFLPGPGFQLTMTPRIGINPTGNFGLNVISS